jgi:hypothetical protein
VTHTAARGVPGGAVVALAVIAVAGSAAAGAGAVKLSHHDETKALHTQVLAAGRQIAIDFAV